MRLVLNAPPGFGKSRLIARLAAASRSLIFVRSHLEGLQMAKYVAEYGASAGLLFGRKALCPFGANNGAKCVELRELGVCKARSKRVWPLVFDVGEIYKRGACPYEALHASGREKDVVVLPLAYLSKVSNISAVADLFEGLDFVALDEAHNLLSTVEVQDDELYSRKYCTEEGGTLTCLVLPLVSEVVSRVRSLIAASASITRPFSDIFSSFLDAQYVEVSRLPWSENLEIDLIPLQVRYHTRLRGEYVSKIVERVRTVYNYYRRVVVFLPNRELAEYYSAKVQDLPVSDRPLGDIEHVIITYYGSPISEGINLNVRAGVLVGFPIPNIKSRDLWLKVKILKRLGYSGYKYAVLFTAISHVIQAVGRVLRGLETERKYILLIDDRFAAYRHLLPPYLTL